jgi:hypothetical protein
MRSPSYSESFTADRYTHALVDYREIDRAKLLARARDVRLVSAPVPTQEAETASFAGVS